MTCWFCEKEQAVEGKGYEVEMYGDVVQNQAVTEEAVSFNKKLVVVPRCASCKARQRKGKAATAFMFVFLALALAAAVVGYFGWIAQAFLVWIGVGLAAGLVITFLTARGYELKGIKSEAQAKRHYPEILELKDRDYAFGRAPKQQKVNKALIETDEVYEEVEELIEEDD